MTTVKENLFSNKLFKTNLDLLNIYLNRAAKSYSIGQRLMLFSIPLFSWMLGDITFIIMNLLTIGLMYMTDRF